MTLRSGPTFLFFGYFSLIFIMAVVGNLLPGGFGLIAYLNGGIAILVFCYLFASLLSWQLSPTRRPLLVERDLMPVFLILVCMIVSGLTIGVVARNPKVYVLSTTLYWLNMLMFMIYVSSMDCTRVDILRVIKWIAILSISGFGGDIALRNLMASAFVICIFGERRYGLALLCLLPFALNFSSMNRSGLLAVMTCIAIGAIIYRRSSVFSLMLASVAALVVVFPSINLAAFLDQTSNLFRRLNEIQILLSGEGKLDEIVALQQRIFEIRLVNQEFSEASLMNKLVGLGFGKTLDMTATQDSSVMGASTIGLRNVHNVHSLPHSILLRDGILGIAYLAAVLLTALRNVMQTMFLQQVPPLLGVCVLFPLAMIVSALPAANYFLTEFSLPAMLALGAILIRKQKRREILEGGEVFAPVSSGRKRRRIVWSQ